MSLTFLILHYDSLDYFFGLCLYAKHSNITSYCIELVYEHVAKKKAERFRLAIENCYYLSGSRQ